MRTYGGMRLINRFVISRLEFTSRYDGVTRNNSIATSWPKLSVRL